MKESVLNTIPYNIVFSTFKLLACNKNMFFLVFRYMIRLYERVQLSIYPTRALCH